LSEDPAIRSRKENASCAKGESGKKNSVGTWGKKKQKGAHLIPTTRRKKGEDALTTRGYGPLKREGEVTKVGHPKKGGICETEMEKADPPAVSLRRILREENVASNGETGACARLKKGGDQKSVALSRVQKPEKGEWDTK